MKTLSTISPIVVGLLCAGWLGGRQYDKQVAEKEDGALRQRIMKAEAALLSERESDSLFGKKDGKASRPNWDRILASMQESNTSYRADRKLMEWINGLSKDELINAISEVRQVEGDERSISFMKSLLYRRLEEIDFSACLEAGTAGGLDRGFADSAANCLRKWLKEDPAAAIAWYDRKLAEGMLDAKSLDGINRDRASFEGALLSHLISTNTAEAERRMAEVPKDTRREAIARVGFELLDAQARAALAQVIRKSFSGPDASSMIINAALTNAGNSRQPLESSLEMMNQTQATPEERRQIVLNAGPMIAERMVVWPDQNAEGVLDRVKNWAAGISPESTDRVAAASLGRFVASNKMDQAAAINYLNRSISAGGNADVMIVTFFDSTDVPEGDHEPWRGLASRISDPAKMKRILKELK